MRNINEISFDEFFKIMETINYIIDEDSASFEQMLLHVCRECRLANELYYVICEIYKKVEKFPELVIEHHKVILAMWLLLNDCNRSNTTIH